MKSTYYKLQKDSFISETPFLSLADLLQETKTGNQYWLNVKAATEEMEETLKKLNLHPLIIEDCINPDHGTLIDRYSESVYIEFPTNTSHEYGEVAYLSIICIPALIITIERGDVAQWPDLIASLQKDTRLDTGNTANVLYRLIDFFIEKTITQSLLYRKQLVRLEKKMIQEPDDLDFNLIAELKSQITQLESICEDQLYCAESLVIHDDAVIKKAEQDAYFTDLVSDAEQGLRSISRLTGRVQNLQDNYGMQRRDSYEKRLRILTIISAIFLPLTFITGFFGMNFINMSLLDKGYGEALAIGVMVFTTLGLLWFFNKNGWFD